MSARGRPVALADAICDGEPVPVLHNMSMRPRTSLRWTTGAVGDALVFFQSPRDALINLRRAMAEWGGKRALVRQLDDAWAAWGLIGAALLYPAFGLWPDTRQAADDAVAPPPRRLLARDRDLVLNVLCRARSGLLLPEFPLEIAYPYLRARLWSDDPRLVRLALETGAEEGKP